MYGNIAFYKIFFYCITQDYIVYYLIAFFDKHLTAYKTLPNLGFLSK